MKTIRLVGNGSNWCWITSQLVSKMIWVHTGNTKGVDVEMVPFQEGLGILSHQKPGLPAGSPEYDHTVSPFLS